jgi:hypothetical protein
LPTDLTRQDFEDAVALARRGIDDNCHGVVDDGC